MGWTRLVGDASGGRIGGMISERSWPKQLAARNDPYPAHLRALAYQVWAMVAGQNLTRTRQLLQDGRYGEDPGTETAPVDIPFSTLSYWARTEGWHERAARDRRSMAMGSEERILGTLGFGLASGVDWLRKVADGTEPVRRERDRLDAVRLLADLSGWVGPDRRHAGQRQGLGGASDRVSVDYGSLSDAELLALERGHLPRRADPDADDSPDDTDIVDI